MSEEVVTIPTNSVVQLSDLNGAPAVDVFDDTTDTPSPYSPEEQTALEGLETKYADLRTNAQLVAQGHFTGLYVYGPGGVGKSHQIRQALASSRREFIPINTHVTGAGLFKKMAENRQTLYLIEDLENLFNDRIARNALRAALWGERNSEGRMVRHVRYLTRREEITFEFEGGIIFTMNRPLRDIPELAALVTRILVTNFVPTRTELLALAKKIALTGYRTDKGTLSAEEALEVYKFYRDQLEGIPDRLPDLRLLMKGFEYRLAVSLSSLPNTPLTWQESFRAQLEQSQESVVYSRKSKWAEQEALALELYEKRERGAITGQEMLEQFKARTGIASTQTFYNRLRVAQGRQTPATTDQAPSTEGTS